MQKDMQEYAKICKKYALNMQQICSKYAGNMQQICSKCAQICTNMHEYAQYAQICTNMQKICDEYAESM